MKKALYFLFSFVLILFYSCSNESFQTPEEINQIETRAFNKTYNIGSISQSSLSSPTGLSALCSNLYRQIHPMGGASNLKVQNYNSIGQYVLKVETEGNSPYYVCSEQTSRPGIYKITLKSKVNEKDFNMLMVRVEQAGNTLTLTPIDAELFLTRGIISDIVGDLKVRAQRWWPCFKGFFLDSNQGQVIMFIGAFGGGVGQAVATSFAAVVALGCFG